jgi:hypothetical protein
MPQDTGQMKKNMLCTEKGNVHFLVVANEAGLQQYVQQDQVNKGFAYASQQHGYPLQMPIQLGMTTPTVTGTLT